MARVEPVWNTIDDALVAALDNIRSSQNGDYWHEVRKVYTEAYGVEESGVPKASLPAIIVERVPSAQPRSLVGGSQTVSSKLLYQLTVVMRNDQGDRTRPSKEMNRMVQDIHRALTADVTLGLGRVERLRFPFEPLLDSGALATESDRMVFRYAVEIAYSFDESLP